VCLPDYLRTRKERREATSPLHMNEYTLTDEMTQANIRDAHEHFGEEVSSIRAVWHVNAIP